MSANESDFSSLVSGLQSKLSQKQVELDRLSGLLRELRQDPRDAHLSIARFQAQQTTQPQPPMPPYQTGTLDSAVMQHLVKGRGDGGTDEPIASASVVAALQGIIESLMQQVDTWRMRAMEAVRMAAVCLQQASAAGTLGKVISPAPANSGGSAVNAPVAAQGSKESQALAAQLQQEQLASAYAREQVKLLKIEVDELHKLLDQERQGRLKALAAIDSLEGEPDSLHLMEDSSSLFGPVSPASTIKAWATNEASSKSTPDLLSSDPPFVQSSPLLSTSATSKAQPTYDTLFFQKAHTDPGNKPAKQKGASVSEGAGIQPSQMPESSKSPSASLHTQHKIADQGAIILKSDKESTADWKAKEAELSQKTVSMNANTQAMSSKREQEIAKMPSQVASSTNSSGSETVKPVVGDANEPTKSAEPASHQSMNAGSKKTQDLYSRWKASQKQSKTGSSGTSVEQTPAPFGSFSLNYQPITPTPMMNQNARPSTATSSVSVSSNMGSSSSTAGNTPPQQRHERLAPTPTSLARPGAYAAAPKQSQLPSQRILAAYASSSAAASNPAQSLQSQKPTPGAES